MSKGPDNRGLIDEEQCVNAPQKQEHAALRASYHKAAADAAKKTALVRALAAKGPRAIQVASETAAKAVRRRNVLAAQLAALGVVDL